MKTKVALALYNSHSYTVYRKLVADLLLEGKSTGNEQSEEFANYTKLNESRMNRLEKTIVISEDNILKIKSLKKQYTLLVIAEGWCGDCAQTLPVLNKITEISHHIDMKIVLRDENEDLMNLFLTNGGRAVPKVIVIKKGTSAIAASWGPRPQGAVDLITNYKEKFGTIDETAKTDLQMWYFQDKGISTQNELIDLIVQIDNDKIDLEPSLL